MKTALAADSAKSGKNLAQQTAKYIAQEPWEILRGVGEQSVGFEQAKKPVVTSEATSNKNSSMSDEVHSREQDKVQRLRRVEALNRELKDIERQRVFNEAQRKISEGEDIYLTDIAELDYEQKEVLKAQMQAINAQKEKIAGGDQQLVEPGLKPSRRFLGIGAKSQVQRQQTRVERPLPPSG